MRGGRNPRSLRCGLRGASCWSCPIHADTLIETRSVGANPLSDACPVEAQDVAGGGGGGHSANQTPRIRGDRRARCDAEDDPVDAAMPALADGQGAWPADSTPAAGITIAFIVRNPDVPSLIHATSGLARRQAAVPCPRRGRSQRAPTGDPAGSQRAAHKRWGSTTRMASAAGAFEGPDTAGRVNQRVPQGHA